MMKRTVLFLSCFLSFSCYASNLGCAQAVPTNDPGFCTSFKSVAECHCTAAGLPSGMCKNMNSIYDRMISIFGSIKKACEYQHDTDTQTCIDDWNCYRTGGKDSQGRLCSSTGKACQ
jgi:hypothetical protein